MVARTVDVALISSPVFGLAPTKPGSGGVGLRGLIGALYKATSDNRLSPFALNNIGLIRLTRIAYVLHG